MKHIILILSVIILSLCSCSDHIYSPALYHQDIAYQPKPSSFDTVKKARYIIGGYNYYADAAQRDQFMSAQLNFSQAHTFKHINLAYGAFGVAGLLSDQTNAGKAKPTSQSDTTNVNFNRFFAAVGARASANLYTKLEHADFRYLGAEFAYSHEYGNYSNYRKKLSRLPGVVTDTRTELLTTGLTSEIIFHAKHNNLQQGLRLFIGKTWGDEGKENQMYTQAGTPDIFNMGIVKVGYYVKFNKYFITADFGQQLLIRGGITF